MIGEGNITGFRWSFLVIFLFLNSSSAFHLPQPAINGEASVSKVGVILNLGTIFGNSSRLCMEIALSDFYLSHPHYTSRLRLLFMDSRNDLLSAASAVMDLMTKQGVKAVVGPSTSDETAFVALLGNASKVPVISFSATSPSISHEKTHFFVRAAVSDSFQSAALAAVIAHFNWTQAVPIYEQSEYGAGVIPYIVSAVKANKARVPYRVAIPPSASDDFISKELLRLMNMECRVFLVHMRRTLALRLFAKARELRMMDKDFAWILSDGLTSLLGTVEPSILRRDFSGVLGVKSFIDRSKKLRDFERRWLAVSRAANPDVERSDLTVFGLWAYDTVWALAEAAEGETGITLESILATEFEGMSGDFRLLGGERKRPVFEIVNVVGSSERTVGYWAENTLYRHHLEDNSGLSFVGLSTVIWPGDTTDIPKGWTNPNLAKKLRILVPGPVNPGFYPFLRTDKDNVTGKLTVSGFVIEVFETVLQTMPYAVPVEYVQHETKAGMKKPTYNELVQFVSEQKYDGLVGDVTITAQRAEYVDFTLPYMTSGISLIVPVRDDWSGSAWIFLKPFSWELWSITGASFIFTGLVVWVLEHRANDAFRKPLKNQIGTAFYFIFSTLVFSHKEQMKSNLSRIVVIVWVLVVLVLQSSYIASLTSMLTVRHVTPSASEVRELQGGEYVGFLRGSFIRERLHKEGLDLTKLKPYNSPKEYLDALTLGSERGGVSAIVDEVPYIRVFLKDNCKNYTMSRKSYKVGGFGFVFPKGSPLVADLSMAILQLEEGDKILDIENKWFGDVSKCAVDDNGRDSDRLNMAMFWGLFLITGLASALATIGFILYSLWQKRHRLKEVSSRGTFVQKVVAVAKTFDDKDQMLVGVRQRKRTDATPGNWYDSSVVGTPTPSYCPSTLTEFSPPEEGTSQHEHANHETEGISSH